MSRLQKSFKSSGLTGTRAMPAWTATTAGADQVAAADVARLVPSGRARPGLPSAGGGLGIAPTGRRRGHGGG
ncbi:hypothetical protein SIN09_21670, partial [Streptomyces sp. F8]|nr:hypothetical protein [Streptomyces sp. F8]